MRVLCAVLVVASGAGTVLACSDDTFIATNETLGGGGGATSGGTAGGGAGGAATGAAGTAGAAGGDGAAGGMAGAAGGGGSGGATTCTPGDKQALGTCQKCGTSRRTCQANGTWGDPVCEEQKECNPGDKTTSGCSDPCAEKTCGASCTFGACGKKTGATCLYEGGSNWQCCGAKKWQYCSSACDWHPCQTCSSASSCYTKCT